MKKLNIKESKINDIFNEIVNEDITEGEFDFIDSIQSYINTLIEGGEILFDSKLDINKKICSYINEKIYENKEALSIDFLNKLKRLRIKEYVGLILGNNRSRFSSKDIFLIESDENIDIANEFISESNEAKYFKNMEIDKDKVLTLEYYSNKENIIYDLGQFAKYTKTGNIADLDSANPIKSTKIRLKKGIELTWESYLSRYSYLYFNKISNNGKAINKLKNLIGFEDFSKEYFENKDNVKFDLEKFMKINKLDDYNKMKFSQFELSDSIISSNGKEIKFIPYMINASKYLLGTSGNIDNKHQFTKAFETLKKNIGIDIEEITEDFSKEYFNNPENILYDLNLFKENIKLNSTNSKKTISNLKIANTDRTKTIITKGGKKIGFYMYVISISKEIFGTEAENAKFEESINYVKKLIGIEPLSKEYFYNKENIKYDLEMFQAFTNGSEILDMSSNNPKNNVRTVLKNGKEISWKSYLGQASKYFYGTAYKEEGNLPRFTDALNKLKEIYFSVEK